MKKRTGLSYRIVLLRRVVVSAVLTAILAAVSVVGVAAVSATSIPFLETEIDFPVNI